MHESAYGAETWDGRRLEAPDEQTLTVLLQAMGPGAFVVLGPEDLEQEWWASASCTAEGYMIEVGDETGGPGSKQEFSQAAVAVTQLLGWISAR